MNPSSRLLAPAVLACAVLAACNGADPEPPAITSQPASLSVGEGAQVAFRVAASGDGPLAYAWLSGGDGSAIPGETSDALSFAAQLSDDGRSFQARVSNEAGSATSQAATLSVSERGFSAAADMVTGALPRNLAAIADSNGHIHVLSINGDGAHADVQAHLKLKSTDTMQTSVTLTVPTTSLRVAANGTGHVMAVWQRNGEVGAALYTPASDRSVAGSWQSLPATVSSAGANSALDPAVAAVGDTHFEFVWRERAGGVGPHDIKARRYAIAGNQLDSTIATLEGSSDDAGAPQVAADASGNLIAAWDYSEGGVVINRRAAGSPWTSNTAQAEGAPGYRFELLKVNAAGSGLLLISNRVGGGGFVQLDLTASTPLRQVGSISAYGSAPDAHVFPDGRMRVFGVAVDASNGNASQLFQWSYNPGSGWGSAEPVSDLATDDFIALGWGIVNPQVAGADAAGNLLVTWEERRLDNGGRGRVVARRWLAGLQAWRPVIATSAPQDRVDHRLPVGAVAADGSATIVYRDLFRDVTTALHLR
jgi:hypothetical protein